jgi:hypothetical protein
MTDGRPAEVLACWAAGLVACGSYMGQRLWAVTGEVVDPTVILAVEHVPFYWRCALASLHGGMVALLVWRGVADAEAQVALRHAPWLTAAVLAVCGALAVWVP